MGSLEASIAELKSLPLFAKYDKEQILQLCEGGRMCYAQHRDIVFRAGDEAHSFGIIISGAFKLTKETPSGENTIIHFALPGDAIAAFIMSTPNSKFPITATAMGPSRLLKIPREIFLRNWKQHTEIIFQIQSAIATRMQQLQIDKMLIKAPLSQKLATLLFQLLEKSPQQEQGLLSFQLTRQEIADNLGASVESIIRIMSDWSKQGILETTDRQIRILKVDRLIEELSAE